MDLPHPRSSCFSCLFAYCLFTPLHCGFLCSHGTSIQNNSDKFNARFSHLETQDNSPFILFTQSLYFPEFLIFLNQKMKVVYTKVNNK